MVNINKWSFRSPEHNVRAGVSLLRNDMKSDSGITLVELLAALSISVILMGVIGMIIVFQTNSWSEISQQGTLQSYVQMADQRLQREFQNITLDKLSQISTTEISGTCIQSFNASPTSFDLKLVPAKSDHGYTFQGILLTDGSDSTILQWDRVDFSGTTFSVDSSTEMVTIHLVAKYVNVFGRVSQTFVQDTDYVIGGVD